MNSLCRSILSGLILLMHGLAGSVASAQSDWPQKPLKVIVGYSAGGGTDTYARIVASLIHEELDGMPMVVINKPGAASMIALKHVVEQPRDGHTLVMQAVGAAISNELIDNSPAKFRDEFIAIGTLGQVPAVIAVPYDSPLQTLGDMIESAQANPDSLRYAHPGRTDFLTMGFEKTLSRHGIELQDVPFKGGAPAKAATVAGQVDMGLMNIQHLEGFESKLRGLAVLASNRSPIKDDVATMEEQGYDSVNVVSQYALFVRTGTPEEIVERLRNAVAAVVEKKGYKRLIKKAGLNDGYLDAEATQELVNATFASLSE